MMSVLLVYLHCRHRMRSRVYETVKRPSVCPIDQQHQWRAMCLLLSARPGTGDID